MTKVIHALGNFDVARGGAQRVAADICIDDDEIEHVIVYMHGAGSLNKLKLTKSRVIGLRVSKSNLFLSVLRLRETIIKERPDIIHVHSPKMHILVNLALCMISYPSPKIVVTIHNTNFDWHYKLSEYFLLKKADKVVASSDKVNDFILSLVPSVKSKSIVVHNGISVERVDRCMGACKPADLEKLFSIPESRNSDKKLVIGFVGRFVRQKNVPLLVSQFEIAAKSNGNLLLILVGDGPECGYVKEQVEKSEFKDRISLVGFQDDVYPFLKIIDIFAMPSRWEGMSIALLEAMVSRKAVVTTKLPVFNEVLGSRGLCCEENQISNSFIKLNANREMVKLNGDYMRSRVLEKFSKEAMNVKYRRCYMEMTAAN